MSTSKPKRSQMVDPWYVGLAGDGISNLQTDVWMEEMSFFLNVIKTLCPTSEATVED